MSSADQLREYHRAARDRDDALAERLAVELAPHFDALAERMDRDPKAMTPAWSELA